MAYTRPQAAPAVANGSGTSIAKAFGSNVTAHSLLVAFATTDVSSSFTFSSPGATWANITPFLATGAGQYISIGYCLDAPAGATTVTCTFGASGNFNGLIIGEYAAPGGVASVLDANTAGQNLATSTTPTDSSVAATAGDLVVSYIISAVGGITITAGSGFTIIANDTTDAAAAEDQLSAAGSVAPAFGFSPTAASGIMSAAFKPADVAVSPTVALQQWPGRIGPWPRTQLEILAPAASSAQVEPTTGEGTVPFGAESTVKKVAKVTASAAAATVGVGSSAAAAKRSTPSAAGQVGLSGLAAAKKVSTPAVRAPAGLGSLATVKKVNVASGRSPLGIGSQSTAKKVSTPSANGLLGVATQASAKKVSTPAGLASLGLSSWAVHVDSRAVTASGLVGLAGLATARKAAPAIGSGAVGLTAAATAKKAARPALNAPAGLVGLATAKKVARPAGSGWVGLTGLSTAQKRATPTGNSPFGFTTWANRQARQVTAFGWLGVGTSSTVKKRSTPLASGPLGLAGISTAKTIRVNTARSTFGVGGLVATGKRQAVTGRALAGITTWLVYFRVPPTTTGYAVAGTAVSGPVASNGSGALGPTSIWGTALELAAAVAGTGTAAEYPGYGDAYGGPAVGSKPTAASGTATSGALAGAGVP